jgi:hypothetical protein
MQYRKFGSLDWEVSALGFGCMRLPTKKKFGFLSAVDEPEAIKMLHHAIDNGVNYVDTAYMYHNGKSEVVVGKALQGYREKVHLVTKLPMGKVKSPDDVDKLLCEQLKKLKTDHLDIYLFHGLNKKTFELLKSLDLMKKMEAAKASGKINHIGFSFHDNFDTFKEIIDYYAWDACQVQMNYMDVENQATMKGLKYAASKGIGVIIMEPLRGGRLADPPDEVKKLFDEAPVKRTPADWALQFLWNCPEVSVVLSGMSAMQQVEENLKSADVSGIGTLTDEEAEALAKASALVQNALLVPCTACQYCMPCPNGVMIPNNFRIVNEMAYAKDIKRLQMFYKRIAKENGTADYCTECNACLEKCPQQIQIPTELKKVKKVMSSKKNIVHEVFQT